MFESLSTNIPMDIFIYGSPLPSLETGPNAMHQVIYLSMIGLD